MVNPQDLKNQLQKFKKDLQDALYYLEYSDKKVQSLPFQIEQLGPEELETWEAYTARFSRATDIFFQKYLRTKVLLSDPAFRGSFRDFLDEAEKQNIIKSTDKWMRIRSLRNTSAHEYTKEDLSELFEAIRKETPFVLSSLKNATE